MKYISSFFPSMKSLLTFTLTLTLTLSVTAQVRVLFVGNSYTGSNLLPKMVKDLCESTGDSLIVDQNTPGGYTLQSHFTNNTTKNKIKQGNWDFVVLQEQSQIPAFPLIQVQSSFYPYALAMDDLIQTDNSCARTIFYMTWGRKNGDQDNCPTWPPVCTYKGMDDLLRQRYRFVADSAKAMISPVGPVWRKLIDNFPTIGMHSPDGSHPTTRGSYAAACAFYTVILQKDPRLITNNYGLTNATADTIKAVVKRVVYDSLSFWNVDTAVVTTSFTYQSVGSYQLQFNGYVLHTDTFYWNINGSIYNTLNPNITFSGPGVYNAELIGVKGCDTVVSSETITLSPIGINEFNNSEIKIYPNPASNALYVQVDRELIGETLQLYSSDGKIVFSHLIDNESNTLNISVLSEGLYFLNIKDLESSGIRVIKSSR